MNPGKAIAARFGWPPWAAEAIKQLIDQPLHVAMCAGSVLAISVPLLLLTVPATAAVVLGTVATATWAALREKGQWPSSRPYDPWLDWLHLVAGMVLGVWLFLRVIVPALA